MFSAVAILISGITWGREAIAPTAQAASGGSSQGKLSGSWVDKGNKAPTLDSRGPFTPLDDKTLYYSSQSKGVGTLARTGGAPANDNQIPIGNIKNRADAPREIAIDADPNGTRRHRAAYVWDSGNTHVQRWMDNQTQATVLDLPKPNDRQFGDARTGATLWAGGEVIQQTGEIMFGAGQDDTIGGNYVMMRLNPLSLTYNYSGRLQPETSTDDIFGGSGQVASDMALDANGNAYLVVNANKAAPEFGVSNERRAWLVRVVPGERGQAWKYNLVRPLRAAPNQHPAAEEFASGPGNAWGMAFYNGMIYASWNKITRLVAINPITGLVYMVPAGAGVPPKFNAATEVNDLAAGQAAIVIEGTVYNDADASGARDNGEKGISGQTIAVYQKNNGGKYELLGSGQTDASGDYSFILGGKGDYVVRLVNPRINGVNAVQTWASGGSGRNSVTPQCVNGGEHNAKGGPCDGALHAPALDPTLDTVGGTGTQPNAMMIYSAIKVTTSTEVADADFGITTSGSWGDSAPGPSYIDAGAPVHVNGSDASLWLGDKLGRYFAPATNNSHSATDDGLFLDTPNGAVDLDGNTFAATKSYPLTAKVTGATDDTSLKAWTAGPTDTSWTKTAVWTPTIADGRASAPFVPSAAAIGGTSKPMQLRADLSYGYLSTSNSGSGLQTITDPTNAGGQYQSKNGGKTSWTTPGEVEDYSFNVADAAYRAAVKTISGQGQFTIDGQSVTADASAWTYTQGKAASTTGTTTFTAKAPDDSWTLDKVDAIDTLTGDPMPSAAATFTRDGLSTDVTFSASLGDDTTLRLTYVKAADATKSTLSLDKPSAPVGTDVTATARVVDSDDNPLAGQNVQLTNAHPGTVTLSSDHCVTDDQGLCSVTLASSRAGSYPDEVSATLLINGAQRGLSGSPASVTFTAGAGDPLHSTLTVTPDPTSAALTVGSGDDSAYTATTLVRDSSDNPSPGQTVTYSVTREDGTPVDPAHTVLSDGGTCSTGDDGQCAVRLTSTEAGAFVLSSSVAVADGSAPVQGSPMTVLYVPAAPSPHPEHCDGQVGTNLTAVTPVKTGATSAVTAFVTDDYCNPVGAGTAVTFTAHGNGYFLDGSRAVSVITVTLADSKAVAQLTDAKVEVVDVDAALGSLTLDGSPTKVAFETSGASATSSSLSVSPSVDKTDAKTWVKVGPPDGASHYTATVTLRDAQGNVLPGQDPARLRLVPSSPAVSVTAITDQGDGTYTAQLSSLVASADTTLTARLGGKKIGAGSEAIPFAPGAPSLTCVDPTNTGRKASHLRVDHPTLSVEQTATAIAYLADANCNPVGPGVDVTFRLDGPGTHALTVPSTDHPVATKDDSTARLAVTDTTVEVVNAVASIDIGVLHGSPQPISFTAGNFSFENSLFVVSPSADLDDPSTWVEADGVSKYVATLTAKDGSGNLITDLDLDRITFGTDVAEIQVSTIVNHRDGTYSVDLTSTKATDEAKASVEVDAGQVGSDRAVPFDAGDPAMTCDPNLPRDRCSRVEVDPSSTSVDDPDGITVRSYVFDQFGNEVSTGIDYWLDAGSSATVTPQHSATWSRVRSGHPSTGWIHAAATIRDDVAEKAKIHARVTGGDEIPSAQEVEFTRGELCLTPGTSSYAVAPTSGSEPVVADGVQSWTGTVTAKDCRGNLLPDLSASDFLFAADGSTRVGAPVTSDGAGHYSVTFTSTRVGTATTQAYYQSDQQFDPQKLQIRFSAGPVCLIEDGCAPVDPKLRTGVAVVADQASADGVQTDRIEARAYDAQGHPLEGVDFAIATHDAALTLSGSTITTTSTGRQTMTATSRVAGTHLATASVGGKELSRSGSPLALHFNPTVVVAGKSSLSVDKNASAVTDAITATVTARDAQGNLAGEGASFAFTVSGSGKVLGTCTTTADSTCSVPITDDMAEHVTLHARLGDEDVQGSPKVLEFTAGQISFDPGATAYAVVPTSGLTPVLADGVQSWTGTVTAKDAKGNLLTGLAERDFAVAADSGVTVSAVASDGLGHYAVRFTSTSVGQFQTSVKYKDSDKILPGDLAIEFSAGQVCVIEDGCTPTDPDPAHHTGVSVTRDNQAADGVATDEVTARAFDIQGHPVAGVEFALATSDAALSLAKATIMTGADGTGTVTATSTVAGEHQITASIGSTELTQSGSPLTLSFRVGAATALTSSVVVDRESATVGDSITATVTARDAQGNIVDSGVSFEFEVDGSATVESSCTTAADGTCAVTITDDVAQTVTLKAQLGDDEIQGSPKALTFTPGAISFAPDATSYAATATGSTPVVADGVQSWTGVVTAKDEKGNLIPGLTTTDFAFAADSGVTVSAVTADGSGHYSATFTSTKAGEFSTHATYKAGDKIQPGDVPITFVAGSIDFGPGATSYAVAPTSGSTPVLADGVQSWTGTVTARDAKGNLLSGLTASDFGFTADPAVMVSAVSSDSAGHYSVTFTSTTVGSFSTSASYQAGDKITPGDLP
ncbi:MAG: Ig-like domain-containing protein, partial [Propionibacteriaceae bacterium]|nr:Ig-like domain-containing protein [Propionibacteriaceae bacterium]